MPKRLLPLIPAGLLVQQVLPTSEHITIKASPRQNAAACPDCGVASRRVHSRYGRTLADLPWQGRPVTLAVHARRFRCLNSACARQTFAGNLVAHSAMGFINFLSERHQLFLALRLSRRFFCFCFGLRL